MNENAIGLIFCSWKTAEQLIDKDPEVADSLVITSRLSDHEVILTEKDEFFEWLYGKGNVLNDKEVTK